MYYYIHISERIYSDLCRVKRIFYRNPKPLNGHAPFFLAILDPLDKNERIYSDFYALFKPILAIIVGGLNRSDWVGMLRFQHITNIYKEVVTKGVWQKVGKLPIRDEFKNPPMQYIYHDYSGKFKCYNPMTGEIFPIEKEQAVGLERAAVWDAHHIVDRIYDHYNGTPCKWLKQHYELFKEES